MQDHPHRALSLTPPVWTQEKRLAKKNTTILTGYALAWPLAHILLKVCRKPAPAIFRYRAAALHARHGNRDTPIEQEGAPAGIGTINQTRPVSDVPTRIPRTQYAIGELNPGGIRIDGQGQTVRNETAGPTATAVSPGRGRGRSIHP
jgi:hypothetical protein